MNKCLKCCISFSANSHRYFFQQKRTTSILYIVNLPHFVLILVKEINRLTSENEWERAEVKRIFNFWSELGKITVFDYCNRLTYQWMFILFDKGRWQSDTYDCRCHFVWSKISVINLFSMDCYLAASSLLPMMNISQ